MPPLTIRLNPADNVVVARVDLLPGARKPQTTRTTTAPPTATSPTGVIPADCLPQAGGDERTHDPEDG